MSFMFFYVYVHNIATTHYRSAAVGLFCLEQSSTVLLFLRCVFCTWIYLRSKTSNKK